MHTYMHTYMRTYMRTYMYTYVYILYLSISYYYPLSSYYQWCYWRYFLGINIVASNEEQLQR